MRRRARPRTDLPGGAVPQHDDFQLPVLALLLGVRHGVPGTRSASPHPPRSREEEKEGGLRGRGEEEGRQWWDRTPRPGASATAGEIRDESLAGRHLARRPSPCARPRPLRATSDAHAHLCTNPRPRRASLASRSIRGPEWGETFEPSRRDAALPPSEAADKRKERKYIKLSRKTEAKELIDVQIPSFRYPPGKIPPSEWFSQRRGRGKGETPGLRAVVAMEARRRWRGGGAGRSLSLGAGDAGCQGERAAAGLELRIRWFIYQARALEGAAVLKVWFGESWAGRRR